MEMESQKRAHLKSSAKRLTYSLMASILFFCLSFTSACRDNSGEILRYKIISPLDSSMTFGFEIESKLDGFDNENTGIVRCRFLQKNKELISEFGAMGVVKSKLKIHNNTFKYLVSVGVTKDGSLLSPSGDSVAVIHALGKHTAAECGIFKMGYFVSPEVIANFSIPIEALLGK